MAQENGRTSPSVSETLLAEGHRFDFVQAVRMLEFLAREVAQQEGHQAARTVGRNAHPSTEVARFRAATSLMFPAAAIGEIGHTASRKSAGEKSAGEKSVGDGTSGEAASKTPRDVTVAFLGLTGPSGVLPVHYTAMLIERCQQARDYSLRDFLDIFHHRATSFFYRASQKYHLPLGYERHRLDRTDGDDLFTHCLRCLIGMGTGGLRGRGSVDDEALVYYAGHFAHFPRSAVALQDMLTDYFQMRLTVIQFSGQWLALPPENRSCMPSREHPRGLNNELGRSAVIGTRIWSPQTRFRLRLGPLSYRQFRDFMPTGRGLRRLSDLVRLYVGPQFDFDVQVVLKASEVPAAQLGYDRDSAPRLGWNSWSKVQEFTEDAENAVFELENA